MPTYEYLCPAGHVFDLFQKMSVKPRAKCPKCGRMASRQISGGAGLVFKGSGFYITDYGKDGKGPRKESAPASENASGEKPGGEKPGGEKTAPEKAAAAEKPAEQTAEKSTKSKSSKKARE